MNILKRPTPSGFCIFCDDIRHEINGKSSLIGIYGNQLLPLGPFPIMMPKLCVDVNYYQNEDDEKLALKIQVVFAAGSEEKLLSEISIPSNEFQNAPPPIPPEPGDQPLITGRIPFEFIAYVIEKAGRIRVLVHRGDDVLRIGSLSILPYEPPPQISDQQSR